MFVCETSINVEIFMCIEKLLGILHYFVNYSFSLAEENGNDEEENILKRRRLLDKNAPSMALQDQFSLLF